MITLNELQQQILRFFLERGYKVTSSIEYMQLTMYLTMISRNSNEEITAFCAVGEGCGMFTIKNKPDKFFPFWSMRDFFNLFNSI